MRQKNSPHWLQAQVRAVWLDRPNGKAAHHSGWRAALAGTDPAAADTAAAGPDRVQDRPVAADPDTPDALAVAGLGKARTVQLQAVRMAVALDSAGSPDTVLAPGMAADIVAGWLLLVQPCLLRACDAL